MARRVPVITWKEAARTLHLLNPKHFTFTGLAELFGKHHADVWWAVHSDWRRELDNERNRCPKHKAKRAEYGRRYYAELKADPKRLAEYRQRKRRYMATKRKNESCDSG